MGAMEEKPRAKSDGFIGEKMIVIPKADIEQFKDNIFVRRMYVTDIGYFPNAENHYINRPQGVEEFIYFFCVSGKGTVIINNDAFPLNKNMAICIPQHAPHSYYSSDEDPWSILWVHFNGTDACHYPLHEAHQIYFRSPYSANRMLFFFNEILRILENDFTLRNCIYISHSMHMILSETYYKEDIVTDADTHNDYLNVIIKYFNANLTRNLSLQNICDEFKLSKSYLNTLFNKNTGISPINYFIRMKMKEACKMIRSTDFTIKIIAANLGYYDEYHFSFLFKKIVGVSPMQYRNSNMVFL